MGRQTLMQKTGWVQRHISKHRLLIAGVFVYAVMAHLFYLAPGGLRLTEKICPFDKIMLCFLNK